MKLSEGLRKGLAIKEKIGRPYCAAVIVAARLRVWSTALSSFASWTA